MKRTIFNLLSLALITLVLFTSCLSAYEVAEKAYQEGDFSTSIEESLKSLKKEPELIEAETILKNSWQQANSEWEAQIETFEKETVAVEIEKAIPLYEKLLKIHTIVQEAQRNDLNPDVEGISEREATTRKNVISLHLEEGKQLLEKGDRDSARLSIVNFSRINKLDPENTVADSLIDKAIEMGTAKVMVFSAADTSSELIGEEQLVSFLEKELEQYSYSFIKVIPNSLPQTVSIENAKIAASKAGANVLAYIQPDTNLSFDVNKNIRPIDSYVSSAPDWKVEEYKPEASVESEVNYLIFDLDTEQELDNGTLAVNESSDLGLSVSAILNSDGKVNVTRGDFVLSNLLNNSLRPEARIIELRSQLYNSQEVKDGQILSNGISPLQYLNAVDFDNYNNLNDVASLVNNHTFILFDVVEEEVMGIKNYESLFEGNATSLPKALKLAEIDRTDYKNYVNWLNKKSTSSAAKRTYALQFFENELSAKIAERIKEVVGY